MERLTVTFAPLNGRLDGRQVTALGLQGLLFNVLRQADVNETTWLHSHPAPNPFAMVPLYDEAGELAGLQLAAVTARSAALLRLGWERAWQSGRLLRLGPQEFRVSQVERANAPGFAELASRPPARRATLHFLSPTSFKKGPGSLPLPLPENVFARPFRAWQTFAPAPLRLPDDWLKWVRQDVFVVDHRIETATVNLSKRETLTGFVGWATFEAHRGSPFDLSVWQALAQLAAFCGVGRKAAMGMGAVTIV
jgi:CRISPR-associated endoribonuclease Cas6